MTQKLSQRDEFIRNNLGLARACAHRFTGKSIEYDDLYSAGCVGLVKAADAFDKERGVKFSTYAVPVILGEIKKLFRDGGTVKVSRSLKELSLKLNKEREKYIKKEGKEPTISKLAEMLSITKEQAAQAVNVAMPTISLTDDDESGGRQIDIKSEVSDDKLTDKIALKEAIKHLSYEDGRLIVLRYFQGKTQGETAKRLKMSQVQVSRKEKKILVMLKEELK